MRRIALLVALVAAMLMPASVAARSTNCSLDVSPRIGTPTSIYRLTVSNVPLDPAGGSVEVQIDIHRLGTKNGALLFVFVIPGVSRFYVDYNAPIPDEPNEPLAPGVYKLDVHTPHIGGCQTGGIFIVR